MKHNNLLQNITRTANKLLAKRVPYNPNNRYLETIFAPTHTEHTTTQLKVTGQIPSALNGILTRIGPNPKKVDNPGNHSWFVGDGMVHGVRIQEGQAVWYRNRYVADTGQDRALEKQLGAQRGISGVVNTNIIGHGGRLWALVEAGSFPVELNPELTSVHVGLFDSTLNQGFTAHPHLDPKTGELHAICYDALKQNHVTYLVIDQNCQVTNKVSIPVKHGPMMHDGAMTSKSMIIFDLPVTFSGKDILKGAALPYRWNPKHPARVGVLPRHGSADDVRWFDVDPCYVFHSCNAFERDNGEIVVDVVAHPKMFGEDIYVQTGPELNQSTFERWTIKPNSKKVHRQVILSENQEFPRFDERFAGQDYRHAYTISLPLNGDISLPNQLLHFDLETGETHRHSYGENQVTGEVVFVPRNPDAPENDGWLMSYVHDLNCGNSKIVILDSLNLGGEPVAEIELPVRVPMGFHGNWIADLV
jgi:carotenoid cleavage dioxygenase-like enzyme